MITAGMVSVENGRKDGGPNDYVPTKKVRVDLSFTVETHDQAEATLDRVMDIAQSRVAAALGYASKQIRADKVTLGEQIAHEQVAQRTKDVIGPEITATDVKAREKELLGADRPTTTLIKPAPKSDVVQAVNAALEGIKSTDAIVIDTSLPAAFKREQPAKDNAALVVEPPKPAVETPKAIVISDADIMKAITVTNAQVKNAKAITALIHKHTAELAPEKHTASQIPQNRRAQFIDDLELLKVSGPTVA